MRAIWKGAVSFGLVNVPIRLNSAVAGGDYVLLCSCITPSLRGALLVSTARNS